MHARDVFEIAHSGDRGRAAVARSKPCSALQFEFAPVAAGRDAVDDLVSGARQPAARGPEVRHVLVGVELIRGRQAAKPRGLRGPALIELDPLLAVQARGQQGEVEEEHVAQDPDLE